MALQDTDFLLVQRGADSFKMLASGLTDYIGEGVANGGDPPDAPVAGQLWFDVDVNVLYYYDGTDWVPINPGPDTTPPANPANGTLWYDTSVHALKVYNETDDVWVYSIVGGEALAADPTTYLTEGKLYWNTADKELKAYDGTEWVTASGGGSISVGETPPSPADQGDLWWESDTGILYIYYGPDAGGTSQWVQAAGSVGGDVDLTGYATEAWVTGELAVYARLDGAKFSGGVAADEVAVTSGANVDLADGNFFTISGSVDLGTPVSMNPGQSGVFKLAAGATITSYDAYYTLPTGWDGSVTGEAVIPFYVSGGYVCLGYPTVK